MSENISTWIIFINALKDLLAFNPYLIWVIILWIIIHYISIIILKWKHEETEKEKLKSPDLPFYHTNEIYKRLDNLEDSIIDLIKKISQNEKN